MARWRAANPLNSPKSGAPFLAPSHGGRRVVGGPTLRGGWKMAARTLGCVLLHPNKQKPLAGNRAAFLP